jgi:hypothetical protein
MEIEGQTASLTLLRGSALSLERDSGEVLNEVLIQEASVMRRCLAVGPVAVDIPIDLKGLPNVDRAEFVWQLTRRPIDRASGVAAAAEPAKCFISTACRPFRARPSQQRR